MTAGIVIALLLAAGTLAYIAIPLFQRDAGRREKETSTAGEARDLQSRQEMLLAAIRDLEDDRATDKIDETDYDELKARLSGEAVEVMKRLDAARQQHDHELKASAPKPIQHPGPRKADRSA